MIENSLKNVMSKKKRLSKIKEVLMEMGAGRFFYRIERSSKSDNVEALISVINMMGEEIEEALVHQEYVNVNETIKHIVLMNFQIDYEGRILAINPEVCDILFYRADEIVERAFMFFLGVESKSKWKKYLNGLLNKKSVTSSLDLIFVTQKGLLIPSACYINKLEGKVEEERTLMLTVVKHSKKQVELENYLIGGGFNKKNNGTKVTNNNSQTKKQKVRLNSEDIRKIREARNFLMDNLEKDFPSLRDLALQFGTNTFKLKYGFKELYGTSVFRFLRNERLRKAKILVQGGNQSFKTIAYLCGFKSVPTFTNTFKSEFGVTPTELRKKFLSEDM
tara:strand:- start:21827 stop:22828 length:1002 start_codon:yes stop_codon:yes gene_type:complete